MHRRLRARRPRSRGQGLAEFAIVFPVLMLIIGGIIQFGIIFWGQNTLTQIARDTGRWAASQLGCSTATVDVLGTAKSLAASSAIIGNSAGWTSPTNVDASWSGTPCPPKDNQDVAYVTITLHHQVPVFFPLLPGNGNLTTSAEFRMEPKP
ncbi:MAG TPA: TadE family protein [Candidatus Limnocylindrales bacterium]